jgi:hypothetical protein
VHGDDDIGFEQADHLRSLGGIQAFIPLPTSAICTGPRASTA